MKILQRKSKLDNSYASADSELDNEIKSFKMKQLKKVSSDVHQNTSKKSLIPTRSLLNLSNKNIVDKTSHDTSAKTSLDTSLNSNFSGQNDISKLSISKPIIQHSSYASSNLGLLTDVSFDSCDFQPSVTSTPKSNGLPPRPPPPAPPLPPPTGSLTQSTITMTKNNPLDKYKIDFSEYSNLDKKHVKALKTSEKIIQKHTDVLPYPTIAKLAFHPNLAKSLNQTAFPAESNKTNPSQDKQIKLNSTHLDTNNILPIPPPPLPPTLLTLTPSILNKPSKNVPSKPLELNNDKSALLDQIRSFKGFSENDKAKIEKCTSNNLSTKASRISLKPVGSKDVLNDEIKKFANRGFSDKAKQNLKNAEFKIHNHRIQNNVTESLNESIEKILSSRRAYLGKPVLNCI